MIPNLKDQCRNPIIQIYKRQTISWKQSTIDDTSTNNSSAIKTQSKSINTKKRSSQHPNIPIDDGINNDLNWVQVSEQVDDLHGMLDNPDSHELLSIVPPVHHQRVGEPLNNGALRFPEPLHWVPTSSVRNICRRMIR